MRELVTNHPSNGCFITAHNARSANHPTRPRRVVMLVRGHPNLGRNRAEIVPAMLNPGIIEPAVLHPSLFCISWPESKTKPCSLYLEHLIERDWLKKWRARANINVITLTRELYDDRLVS